MSPSTALPLAHQRPVLDMEHPLTSVIVALETMHEQGRSSEGRVLLRTSDLEFVIAQLVDLAAPPRAASLEFNERTGLNVAARHPAFFALAQSVVAFFEETKAEHHVTVTLADPVRGAFDLTVQRRRGLSPAERNSALCRVLRQVRDRLNDKEEASFVWSTRHELVERIDAALGAQRQAGPGDGDDPVAAAARQVEVIVESNRKLLEALTNARDAVEVADAALVQLKEPTAGPFGLRRNIVSAARARLRELAPGLLDDAPAVVAP
jgi:hypothetical protein